MNYKIINFDEKFQSFITDWIKQNSSKYENIDDMENEVPELYEKWLITPADWLGGCSPSRYFNKSDSAGELIELMFSYMRGNVPVPDTLYNSIIDYEQQAADYLVNIIRGQEEFPEGVDREEAMMAAINLVNEIDCATPYSDYIEILSQDIVSEGVAELLIEILVDAPESIVNEIFNILDKKDSAKATKRFLHVLAAFQNDDRIYKLLWDEFIQSSDDRALIASYLGKFGNPAAIDVLKKALDWSDINYLDYIEMRNAIEELGGEVNHSREFEGDNYYESLKGLE